MGLTAVALPTGSALAANVATATSTAATLMVGQSIARMPNNWLSTSRPSMPDRRHRDQDAGPKHRRCITQDQPHRMPRDAPERDADPDLARPMRDDERHDAVDADDREHHREPGESARQHRQQPLVEQRAVELIVQRTHRPIDKPGSTVRTAARIDANADR